MFSMMIYTTSSEYYHEVSDQKAIECAGHCKDWLDLPRACLPVFTDKKQCNYLVSCVKRIRYALYLFIIIDLFILMSTKEPNLTHQPKLSIGIVQKEVPISLPHAKTDTPRTLDLTSWEKSCSLLASRRHSLVNKQHKSEISHTKQNRY